MWDDKKVLCEKRSATKKREQSEKHQGAGHDERRLGACASHLAARFAEKDDDEQTQDVECGQKSGQQCDREDRHLALVGEREDCVFAEKSAERRATDQGKRAGREGQKGSREVFGE